MKILGIVSLRTIESLCVYTTVYITWRKEILYEFHNNWITEFSRKWLSLVTKDDACTQIGKEKWRDKSTSHVAFYGHHI